MPAPPSASPDDPPSVRAPWSARTIGIAAAITTILIWVSFIVIARASAAHTLLPMDIVWARYLGAGAALLPWMWWIGRRSAQRTGPDVRSERSLLGLSPLPMGITTLTGVLGGLLYAGFAYSGFFFAPAAHASILLPGSLPLWTALLSWLVLHDRIAPARLTGLAFILCGCLLGGGASLLGIGNVAGSNSAGPGAGSGALTWVGDLLFACAALTWSSYGIVLRKYALDAVKVTAAVTAFTCVTFLPVYSLGVLAGWIPSRLFDAPWQELAFQMVFQGVFSVVISGISFALMIRHFGPVRSTMLTAVVPGLSALGAALVLGEPLHWHLLLGLALVTLGIVIGAQRARPIAPVPAG